VPFGDKKVIVAVMKPHILSIRFWLFVLLGQCCNGTLLWFIWDVLYMVCNYADSHQNFSEHGKSGGEIFQKTLWRLQLRARKV